MKEFNVDEFVKKAGIVKAVMLKITTPTEMCFLCMIVAANLLNKMPLPERQELLTMLIEQLNHWSQANACDTDGQTTSIH